MGVGLAAAFAIAGVLAGFLLGFLVGARARQISAKLKAFGRAVLSLHLLLKIKEAMAGMDDAEAMANDDDADPDEGKGDRDKEELLDEFLFTDAGEGLEDHPDVEISPVILYQIKKSKDQQRLEKQKALLMAEGLTEAEAEERMHALSEGGGAIGDGRANALAVLIAAGARVESAKGATSDDMVKRQDLRRKQRNVNVFIQKAYDIETVVKPKKAEDGIEDVKSRGNKKTAVEVARETKFQPVGGQTWQRELKGIKYAKSARSLLKEHKIRMDAEEKRKKDKKSFDVAGTVGLEFGDGKRREAGLLRASELADLLAEGLGDEAGGEEGEEGEEGYEGEEGEEGGEDEDADVEA